MNLSDSSLSSLMKEAEKLGKEQEEFESRNKRRKAKGRKPLADAQTKQDRDVLSINYRTGDATTVDGDQALRIYEERRALMAADLGDDDDEVDEETPSATAAEPAPPPAPQQQDEATERAIREAEAVRRIQDMKAGRIDHEGNWSPEGQKLEGGDPTAMPATSAWDDEEKPEGRPQGPQKGQKKPTKAKSAAKAASASGLDDFKADLYERLRVSFEALETTLSDLQGRVAEIVTASANVQPPAPEDGGRDEFDRLLSQKTPVTFDVGGAKMTFDAVTVFHAPPCITVVSKFGSATIMPRPGAQLRLTYEMDGTRYENDPVTFLGTRFDLPMFGLSFVGFIRDRESDMMDVAAGE